MPDDLFASTSGDQLRQLAAEMENPVDAYKSVASWRERSLAALSHAPSDLSLSALHFEASTRDLRLPDPQLAESWDVWDFEESVRKAAAILIGAAADLDQHVRQSQASVSPDALRNAIADTLANNVKAYDLPGIGIGLGLTPGEGADAYRSKRVYVKSRLLQKRGDELIELGEMIIEEYGDPDLRRIVARFREQRAGYVSPGANLVGDRLAELTDWDAVQRAWTAALEKIVRNPDGSITAARTMLESVCKHICDERNVHYDSGWDLTRLYKAAAASMRLAPDQHTEQVIKQILSGVTTVVGGLASMRNSLSDAHGRGKGSVRPRPRHAKLAVNSAFAVAGFLIDSHVEMPVVE
jgi:abortive infection Abi-like protein